MANPNETSVPQERLTTPEFWDSCYQGRDLVAFNERDWRNYVSVQLARLLRSLELDGKNVCEIGGDAAITAFLARIHPSASFSIIDFSPLGCALANKLAMKEGVNLNVYQADLFSPPRELLCHFDLVFSLGVVEHFTDLSAVLAAKKKLIKDNGMIFILIPNLDSPIYASLCKRWSKSVFDSHVAHSMNSFLSGHEEAGLSPIRSGYLGAIGFGMLSMAMAGPEPKSMLDKKLYLWLTRISKIVHYMEYRTYDFPTSRLFSPFMYVISKKGR